MGSIWCQSKEYFLEVVGGILGTLLIAVFVVTTTNRQSGWPLLAASYRIQQNPRAMQWRLVSARMGNGVMVVTYRAAINIGADNGGLYLSMFLLFRIGTPPLFIPWEHLSVKPPESPMSGVEFRFLAAPSVFLRVSRSLGAAILTHMPTNSQFSHGTGRPI